MTDDDQKDLFEAVAALQTVEEARVFLIDLATPGELSALAERWRIAQLLDRGDLSYRKIARQIGASTTTVARVARFLKNEPYKGYRLMLDRRAAADEAAPAADGVEAAR